MPRWKTLWFRAKASAGPEPAAVTARQLVPWLLATGLAIVPLFARGARTGLTSVRSRPLFLATVATVAVICAGGMYTMETERILLFAMPWMAVSAVAATATLSGGQSYCW